jgi:hypothetical protein
MHDDYLWDRSGEPDPEIARLEQLLVPYRCGQGIVPELRPRRHRIMIWAAIAASIAAAAFIVTRTNRIPTQWTVQMSDRDAKAVHVGETIETDGAARATLSALSIGEVRLEPNSRMQILHSGNEQERMALSRGTMHALIWAPPYRFRVDTPSATTIDLGCEYTLQVFDDGSGLVKVSRGWVAFEADRTESFIPAGAECRTLPQTGPGVPFFEDASQKFRNALLLFEDGAGRKSLDVLLAEARSRDALTLWHLLSRTEPADRIRVAQKFAGFVANVDAAALGRGDKQAIESAWDALGFGDTQWWRHWKQNWRGL